MFEGRSLVCVAEHDAGAVHEVSSGFVAWSWFGKTKAFVFQACARLVLRLLSARRGLMNSLSVLLLAGLGTMRGQGQSALSVRFVCLIASSLKSGLVSSRSVQCWLQSNPASFERAAKIVRPARSFTPAGITRRSTGLPSAAR